MAFLYFSFCDILDTFFFKAGPAFSKRTSIFPVMGHSPTNAPLTFIYFLKIQSFELLMRWCYPFQRLHHLPMSRWEMLQQILWYVFMGWTQKMYDLRVCACLFLAFLVTSEIHGMLTSLSLEAHCHYCWTAAPSTQNVFLLLLFYYKCGPTYRLYRQCPRQAFIGQNNIPQWQQGRISKYFM